MPENLVQKFTLDGTEINVKDATARSGVSTLNQDMGSLGNRVTALEQSARLSISYNASIETIAFSTGSNS